jgi:hypothetical protein
LRVKSRRHPAPGLAGADDEEGERDVLAGDGDDRQRLEEFVV